MKVYVDTDNSERIECELPTERVIYEKRKVLQRLLDYVTGNHELWPPDDQAALQFPLRQEEVAQDLGNGIYVLFAKSSLGQEWIEQFLIASFVNTQKELPEHVFQAANTLIDTSFTVAENTLTADLIFFHGFGAAASVLRPFHLQMYGIKRPHVIQHRKGEYSRPLDEDLYKSLIAKKIPVTILLTNDNEIHCFVHVTGQGKSLLPQVQQQFVTPELEAVYQIVLGVAGLECGSENIVINKKQIINWLLELNKLLDHVDPANITETIMGSIDPQFLDERVLTRLQLLTTKQRVDLINTLQSISLLLHKIFFVKHSDEYALYRHIYSTMARELRPDNTVEPFTEEEIMWLKSIQDL